jgi:uncharacterized integral membrane protein (TIGR00697 family)
LGALKLGKGALTAWVAVQALIANLFVLKQITLFGLDVTASDAFAVGSLLGLSFLQEYHGKEEARKATWVCFFFMVFFAAVSQLHLLFKASPHDNTAEAFNLLLAPTPRLAMASLGVFFIVQQIDVRFFALLKNKFPHLDFAYRTALVLVLTQFLDTVLFSYAGLYGIVVSMIDIIFVSFLVKLSVIFLVTPVIKWAKA